MNRRIVPWIASGALALTLAGCKVEQTEPGRAPDVDIQVDPGKMPEFDVKTPEVDVKKTTASITVPDVDISTQKKEITIPEVEVNPPQ